jgi:hypothetical protein
MKKTLELLPRYSGTYLGNLPKLPNIRQLEFPSKEVSELFAAKLLEQGIISVGQYNRKIG